MTSTNKELLAVDPDGTLRMGDIEIIPLCDGVVDEWPESMDEMFGPVDAEQWAECRAAYPEVFSARGWWRVDVGCYLLREPGRLTLFDTGMGPADAPYSAFVGAEGRLPTLLADQGVAPGDIDVVVHSHLHPDHIGWNVIDEEGTLTPLFERARHLVHELDLEAFDDPATEERLPIQYYGRLMRPLLRAGMVDAMEGSEFALSSAVRLVHTPGHTPGSITAVVTDGTADVYVWGDAVVHPIQLMSLEASFLRDVDVEQSRDTRRWLIDQVIEADAIVAACHFPVPGFGSLQRESHGDVAWSPLQVSAG